MQAHRSNAQEHKQQQPDKQHRQPMNNTEHRLPKCLESEVAEKHHAERAGKAFHTIDNLTEMLVNVSDGKVDYNKMATYIRESGGKARRAAKQEKPDESPSAYPMNQTNLTKYMNLTKVFHLLYMYISYLFTLFIIIISHSTHTYIYIYMLSLIIIKKRYI